MSKNIDIEHTCTKESVANKRMEKIT